MAKRSNSKRSKPAKKKKNAFFEEMRAQLEQKMGELTDTISSSVDDLRSSDHYESSDLEDVGGEAQDEETAFRLLELESAELEQIEYALERLDAGTYGQCEECSEKINLDRLMALPFATLCIACKRIAEQSSYDLY